MNITVIGMDPSLSNWGFIKAKVDVDTQRIRGSDALLCETKPGKDKKTVRKNSDDLKRARALSDALKNQCEDVAIAFVEVPVGSQSAASMKSYGVCIGILSMMSIPMIQVSPDEVKLAGAGCKNATKEEMITAHPEIFWLKRKTKGDAVLLNKNEHLADALGAIYAGMKTEDFQSVLAIANMARNN